MRVLLVGADGYIGSHLARGLRGAGHLLSTTVFGRPARDDEIYFDLTHPDALEALPCDVDVLVNASGVVDPRVSAARMFAVNLRGTERLLGWARSVQVKHFVQLSSVAVYGPLVLGTERTEGTARLGKRVGLPYMRSKALAECAVERAGVPYTILRPPAVLGDGDRVVAEGFFDALCGAGLPMLPSASPHHLVSLSLVEGLTELILRTVARGPLRAAVHAADLELPFGELASLFATALGRPRSFVATSWGEAISRRADAGFAWLFASARFGQHYTRARQIEALGARPAPTLESAILAGLSGLQGGTKSLF